MNVTTVCFRQQLEHEFVDLAMIEKRACGVRVLHVVDHSVPMVDGYSIRTRGIVEAQQRLGLQPTVLTGPLHEVKDDGGSAQVNGIQFLRTPLNGLTATPIRRSWAVVRELAVLHLFRARIVELLRRGDFDIVHAHSPALCGLAAAQALNRVGAAVPFIYEIRAFWEDAVVDQGRTRVKSIRYRASRGLENHVVRRANAVVGIAQSILEDLKARGFSGKKLYHVPNGVDTCLFYPQPRDQRLRDHLRLSTEPVLGFVGSLFFFEGVSWLIHACAELYRRGVRFQLLVIGKGEDEAEVRRAIQEEQAEGFIRFIGKVPFSDIPSYYSIIDVMVYPRRSVRLTELVTPLKPLEAMAQGIAVLGSAVGGIRELVRDDVNGLLFRPESIDDFCRQTRRLLENPLLRSQIAQQARSMVLHEKDWSVIARSYFHIYERAAMLHKVSSARRSCDHSSGVSG